MGNCIICKRKLNNPACVFDSMPAAAQNMPDKERLESDEPVTLELFRCKGCGLVQFDIEPVSYYRDVIRATRVSDKFRKLRMEQYAHFIDICKLEGKKIIEVGCGAGEFLEILQGFPVEAYGIENNAALVQKAYELGLDVEQGFVENEDSILSNAPFDAFISFNFLEHQPNPVGMLQGIYENLTEDGVGLVTVPSFEYFQEHGSYYEFIRDHISYYTEDTLKRLLDICGFEVLECKRFNRDTIEVIVKKRKEESFVNYYEQQVLMNRKMAETLRNLSSEERIFVWGASHQGFTLLSTLDSLQKVDKIIDSADFKWNKYSPVSHVEIVSPDILKEETPECIIIMAPGYSDEIYRRILQLNPNIKKIFTVIGEEITELK